MLVQCWSDIQRGSVSTENLSLGALSNVVSIQKSTVQMQAIRLTLTLLIEAPMINRLLLSLVILISMSGLGSAQLAINPCCTTSPFVALESLQTDWQRTSSSQPLAMQPLSYSTCVRNCRRSGNSQNVCGDCCANGSCPPYPIGMGFRQVQYQMEPTIRLQSSTRFRLLRRLFGN